jgi:D-beta-D-heptose 7-phosphate kinase/D-beta-D-heptose 1-phosphate adenosyltransferase
MPPSVSSRLVALVRRFSRLRALVIGDAILDSYLDGVASRLSSEGPVPVVLRQAERHAPGGAANTASNLRALGADVLFIGVVGEDEAGGRLLDALRMQGVDDGRLIRRPDRATVHKMRILANGQYVVRVDHEDRSPCATGCAQRLADLLEEQFDRCDAVVVSDYGYGTVAPEVIERIRRLQARRPSVLLIDAKKLRRFRDVPSTVVTPNLAEAQHLLDGCVSDSGDAIRRDDPAWITEQLFNEIPTAHLALTLGAEGLYFASRSADAFRLPARPLARAHDIGAGDSFAAALALSLAAEAAPREAAALAMQAAAIAVSKPGTASVAASELIQQVVGEPARRSRRRVPTHELGAPRDIDALRRELDRQRSEGRSVVFTNGVFDILHAGHIRLLRQAREQGDILVVGVNSDRSVRRLKGRSRPINNEHDRLTLLSALDCVDHVVLFDDDTASSTIRAVRPDIYVKGGDYRPDSLPEAPVVDEVGGRIVILPHFGAISTSQMIDRIVSLGGGRDAKQKSPGATLWA